MPSCYTHQFYAKKVLALIDSKIKDLITNNIDLYLDGALGPDPLYFFAPLHNLPLYDEATRLHNDVLKPLILNSLDKFNDSNISFMFGLITHYILDKNIHGYIAKVNPENDKHVLIESELDKRTALLNNNKHINFHKEIKYKHLDFSYIEYVYNLKPKKFKASLFMMRNAISMSMTYNKIKRFLFKSALVISRKYKKYQDLQIKLKDDHSVDNYIIEINEIIKDSINEIVDVFNEFYDFYNHKIFDISFGNIYTFEGKKKEI